MLKFSAINQSNQTKSISAPWICRIRQIQSTFKNNYSTFNENKCYLPSKCGAGEVADEVASEGVGEGAGCRTLGCPSTCRRILCTDCSENDNEGSKKIVLQVLFSCFFHLYDN